MLPPIPFGVLPRRAVKVIPHHPDAVVERPFEQLDIDRRRAAFLEQLEQPVVQGLDARLDPADSGARQQLDLGAGQVRLGLVEEQIVVIVGQIGEEIAEIFEVEDVVDGHEAVEVVALAKRDDLLLRARFRFGAEGQARAVQPAKGAMVLGAPPASARGLDRQAGQDRIAQRRQCQLVEIIVEIGNRQLVEIVDQRPWRIDADAVLAIGAAARADHAIGQFLDRHVAPPRQDLAAQSGEEMIRLARDDIIDPRIMAMGGDAHLAFAIGAAEQRDDVGIERMDLAQQRQRCAILLEHRAAA